jgi:hypothetical protein
MHKARSLSKTSTTQIPSKTSLASRAPKISLAAVPTGSGSDKTISKRRDTGARNSKKAFLIHAQMG